MVSSADSTRKALTGSSLCVLAALVGCVTVNTYHTAAGGDIATADLRFHYERLVTKAIRGKIEPRFQFVSFVYPRRSLCAKPGVLDLHAVVDPTTGSISDVKVAMSTTDPETGANFVAAAAQWRVRPFAVDGNSQPLYLEIPFGIGASKDCDKPIE